MQTYLSHFIIGCHVSIPFFLHHLVSICNLVAKHNKHSLTVSTGIQKRLSWMFWAQNLLRVQPRCRLASSPPKVCLRLEEPFPTSADRCRHHVGLSAGLLRQKWLKDKKPQCLYNPVSAVTDHHFCGIQWSQRPTLVQCVRGRGKGVPGSDTPGLGRCRTDGILFCGGIPGDCYVH